MQSESYFRIAIVLLALLLLVNSLQLYLEKKAIKKEAWPSYRMFGGQVGFS